MANKIKKLRKKKKPQDSIPIWARVPYAEIERIERALPPYGWRSRLVREVISRVSEHLVPGESPSMQRITTLVHGAVDELFEP